MAKKFSQDELLEILQGVEDPELGYSVVDLGLIYRAEQTEDGIEVDFTLTYIGCPLEDQLKRDIVRTLRDATGIHNIRTKLVWDPPWTVDRASAEVRLDMGYPIW
ncbi:MAG: metal-sulfur cluster assembly factor [Rectinema sp.]|jgi:metal-sulfur cluster biosynthetic enzyme